MSSAEVSAKSISKSIGTSINPSIWQEIVPKGLTTHGLWGMIFQTKTPAPTGGHESFVIELSAQAANALVVDLGTRSTQDKSAFASIEVLKALGAQVKQCSFSIGESGQADAELEVVQHGVRLAVILRPDQVIGFAIAHQAPFRATQEFIDFIRRSRLSSGNFSVLVSERIRSTDSRSIRWK